MQIVVSGVISLLIIFASINFGTTKDNDEGTENKLKSKNKLLLIFEILLYNIPITISFLNISYY
jgi:hypothetical protein